jgi:dienelactone hydrolase
LIKGTISAIVAASQPSKPSDRLTPRALVLRLLLVVSAGLAACLAAASPSRAQTEFDVQEIFLNARIDGRIFRLEALVTKAKGAEGRLPVALLLHGKDLLGSAMGDIRPSISAAQARDLADRGWLAVSFTRRGFGRSDGPFPALASCVTPRLDDQFTSDAGETLAVIEALRQRPDADLSRILAIGVSAGGGAALALAARSPPGLVGIVNLSGGLSFPTCADKSEPALVAAVGRLAGKSKIPQLWIYADNDELFPAPLVNKMHEAALEAGADVRRVSLPKLEPRGHNVFGSVPGRRMWLRELDNSLRGWKLPTHKPDTVVEWSKELKLGERDRAGLERYLTDPTHKAMAYSGKDKRLYWRFAARSAKEASDEAMKDCTAKHQDCRIVLEGLQFRKP